MRRAALGAALSSGRAASFSRACRTPAVAMAWTKQTLQDHFFKEAKKHGYVSRAAFKLLEIQKKHRIIKPGAKVLDLGCVPGAWLQVACQQLGPRERGGLVLGVDLQEPKLPPRHCDDRVRVMQADARLLAPEQLLEHTTDVSMSVLCMLACVCVCVGRGCGGARMERGEGAVATKHTATQATNLHHPHPPLHPPKQPTTQTNRASTSCCPTCCSSLQASTTSSSH